MLPVTIRGRFVCIQTRTWQGFTADDGKVIEAGTNNKLFVLDEAGTLREIKLSPALMIEASKLTFGVECVIDTEAKPYKRDIVFTALQVRAASAVKAA